jgi:antitoxin FitA
MAQILVRNLPDDVKARLQRRAERNARSLEAEVRDILGSVPEPTPKPTRRGAGSKLAKKFAAQKVPQDTWDEFEKNLTDLRHSWRVRDLDLGE